MVDLALLRLTWLVFGLAWHRNGRQWSAWLVFSMVGLAWLCYSWLGLPLLWLIWLVFGLAWPRNGWQWSVWLVFTMVGIGRRSLSLLWLARLGFVMVDLACLWLGMAPLWLAMVSLALLWLACIQLGVASLWATMVGLALLWLACIRLGAVPLWAAMVNSPWLCYDQQWFAWLYMVSNGWFDLAWLCYCCYGTLLWSTQERIMSYNHGVHTQEVQGTPRKAKGLPTMATLSLLEPMESLE